MEEHDNEQIEQQTNPKTAGFSQKLISTLASDIAKKKIRNYKRIAAVAAVIVGIPLLMMLTLSGSSGSYGGDAINSASQGVDAGAFFSEYYGICEENPDECSEEFKQMINSQKSFFERLNVVGNKYNLSEKYRFMILETITYGYDVSDLQEGKTFIINETGEKAETDNVYEEEEDTIEFLAKKIDGSEDNFYNYLIKEDYFDDRVNFINDLAKYGKSKGLSFSNFSLWEPDEKEAARKSIADKIKSSVNSQYPEKKNNKVKTQIVSNNKFFWWPIGSAAKAIMEFKNRVITLAIGSPMFTKMSSPYGMRIHPISGKNKLHDGIDIPASINTPVIASQGGTVIAVNNSCATENSNGCGGGYGNSIKIRTHYGKINLYAHLAKGSITVNTGEEVEQGQVVAGVGSSGNSTGPHLHYSIITENGDFVNPLDYVDPNNPRPTDEYATAKKFLYYNENRCEDNNKVDCDLDYPTTKYGMLLKYQADNYTKKYGYPITTNNNYEEYCDKELPADITDMVFNDQVIWYANYIKSLAAQKGWTFNQNQIDALISLAWSGPSAIKGFFDDDIYNKYGNTERLCTWWRNYYNTSKAAEEKGNDVTDGLTDRRNRECHLFIYGDYGDAANC